MRRFVCSVGLWKDMSEHDVGGSGIAVDVLCGRLACLFQLLRVGEQAVDGLGEVGLVMHLERAAGLEEVLCLAEVGVVGADDGGNAIDGGLGYVVDACTEPAADHGYGGVAVDGGKQAEAVDDEHVGRQKVVLCGFGDADEGACQLAFDICQMPLGDDVRGDDEFRRALRLRVEPGDEQGLVGGPGGTGDEDLWHVGHEPLDDGKGTGGIADVDEPLDDLRFTLGLGFVELDGSLDALDDLHCQEHNNGEQHDVDDDV